MNVPDWFAAFQRFDADQTREAIGLLVDSLKLKPFLNAANGRRGLKSDDSSVLKEPRKMLSKRASRCVVCRAGISVGMPILWEREIGAWHASCEASR